MSNARDDFSRPTVLGLMLRVGGFCSRPECRKLTISPDPHSPGSVVNTGRAAHITAANAGGPRFDATLTRAQRKAPENGIWLCANCADLIDKKAGAAFSVEQIRGWKERAERHTEFAALLGGARERPGWIDLMGSPHYVNLPRIAVTWPDAVRPATLDALRDGFPSGEIIRLLHEAQLVLRSLTFRSVDVAQLLRPDQQLAAGLHVSAWRGFRTKNGNNRERRFVENYSFDHSPLIYTKVADWTYVFPYDPAWVTTATARADFVGGTRTLAVLGVVKHVDPAARTAVCSPLAIGVPDPFAPPAGGW